MKTETIRNVAVTVRKKSHASISRAWLRTKVVHAGRAIGGRMRSGHIATDWPRRDRDVQLQQQFRCNPLLSPGSIRSGHARDELLQIRGKRVRLNDGKDASPLNHPREHEEADKHGAVGPAWLHPPLQVQRQLLAQEEILGAASQRGERAP